MDESEYISVIPLDVVPSVCGCTLFLKAERKIFAINMDFSKFDVLKLALSGEVCERPTTFEFFGACLDSIGCVVVRMDFFNESGGIFYCRTTLSLNEAFDNRIAEIDSRPSDAVPLALRTGAPIFIDARLLARLPDASKMYAEMRESPRL